MHRACLMVWQWASEERKGVVGEEAKERARSSYPKSEMSTVIEVGAHSRLASGRHGREGEEVVQAVLCVTGFKSSVPEVKTQPCRRTRRKV